MYTTAYAHVTALGVAGTRRTRAPRNVHRRGAPRTCIHFVTRIPLNRSVIGEDLFRVFGAVCGLPGLVAGFCEFASVSELVFVTV